MKTYTLRVSFGGWGANPALDDARVRVQLEAFATIAELTFHAYPELPGLYQAGIDFGVGYWVPVAELGGNCDQGWFDMLAVYATRKGNCKDFGPIRVGELRARYGMRVRCGVRRRVVHGPSCLGATDACRSSRTCREEMHVLVEDEQGNEIEDPNRALGMR